MQVRLHQRLLTVVVAGCRRDLGREFLTIGLVYILGTQGLRNYVTFFDGDPRVDGMWTVQNITTKMKVSLTIPYSIYFRMIVYIYIYINVMKLICILSVYQ